MYKKIPAVNTNSIGETHEEILYMDLARLIGFFDVMDRYLHLRLDEKKIQHERKDLYLGFELSNSNIPITSILGQVNTNY